MDEKEQNARALTRLVVFFPILIATFAAATWYFPLVWFVPKFEQMFKEMDIGELPTLTIFVCKLSNAFVAYWYLFFAAYVLGVSLWVNYVSKWRGKIAIAQHTMLWISAGLVTFLMVSLQVINWALMAPLFVIFERIGGK